MKRENDSLNNRVVDTQGHCFSFSFGVHSDVLPFGMDLPSYTEAEIGQTAYNELVNFTITAYLGGQGATFELTYKL